MKLEFDQVADAASFANSPTEIETIKKLEPGTMADDNAEEAVAGIEVRSVGTCGLPSATDRAA